MADEFLEAIPVVICEDIAGEHDFLLQVLRFDSAGLERDRDGNAVHAEVRAGEERFWLHAVSPEHGLATPKSLGGAGGGLVVQVADVDAHFEHVRASGATILSEPTNQEYGQREYGVRDPEGHSWWFATPFASPAMR